jgi:phenylacetate-CoA ligase
LESEYIAEIVPTVAATRDPSVGELVLTNLGRIGSPLIRYCTGDLVKFDLDANGLFRRLQGGILGRVDDMIHLRGNNVYPSAIEGIIRKHAGVAEFRIVIRKSGALTEVRIELEPMPGADGAILIDRVGRSLRDELLFRAEIMAVPPGSLPRYELKAHRVVRD